MLAMSPMFLSPTAARRSGNEGKGINKTLRQNEGVMKRYSTTPQLTLTVSVDAPAEVIDAIALEMSK